MNVIVPIAGKSSRFPDMKPKWMLTHPRGDMMVIEALRGLDLENVERVVIAGLAEHEERYGFRRFLSVQFDAMGIGDKVEFVLLAQQTANQPETVARAIEQGGIEGAIYIKDSDNYFQHRPEPENAVACYDLHELEHVNARNKSYIAVNADGHLVNIVEKKIINSTFCVGGYSFDSAARFMEYFDRLKGGENLYISHLIYSMILDGVVFRQRFVENYVDWGTIKEWNAYKRQYSTLFVDLDGTLVVNSGQYSKPGWGETDGIASNIEAVNALYHTGKVQVIITTSRKEEYRECTVAQLERVGAKYHQIIFGLAHGRRIVINDYAATNPYKSCEAINMMRDSEELKEMLEDSVGFYLDAPKAGGA